MENRKSRPRLAVIMMMILAMLLTTAMPTFAAAPKKESVKYLGKGKVEVEFRSNVNYKNVKVTVKDTSGKTYKTRIYDKDNDELKFLVKGYKTGKTYKFTISGVKKKNTKAYGKVTGSFKIKKASSNITAAKAKQIALKNAGLKASQVRDMDVDRERERGTTYYEVNFETKKYEYEYHISLKGKILYKNVERD